MTKPGNPQLIRPKYSLNAGLRRARAFFRRHLNWYWFTVVVLLIGFGVLMSIGPGEAGVTVDEQLDLAIVNCYVEEHSPFACPYDISQTRLPYYIHWGAQSFFDLEGKKEHYAVSAAFGLATLILIFWFTSKEFGSKPALLALALTATSIPIIASARMVMTHSNIIFTFFATVSIITFYKYVFDPTRKRMITTAVVFGVTVSTNLLAITLIPLFAFLFFLSENRLRGKHFWMIPISIAAFLATSPFYFADYHWFELFYQLAFFDFHPGWWNYFGTGSSTAPWWYSVLLFIVKVTPWFGAAFFLSLIFFKKETSNKQQSILILSIYAGITIFLLGKPSIFGYDAPHHQLQFYPMVYMVIAITLIALFETQKKWMRAGLLSALAVTFVAQVHVIKEFYPQYLFYGAQYGERFIGDTQGPAVLAFQGMEEIKDKIKTFASNREPYLVQTGLFKGPYYSLIKNPDPNISYAWAFSSEMEQHYRVPGAAEYLALLKNHCERTFVKKFPLNIDAFTLWHCDPPLRFKK